MPRLTLSLLLAVGCSGSSAPAGPAGGGPRVVTLGAGLTEIAAALAEDAIVGVDTSSSYPPSMQELTQVGYHRAVHAEGVLSLAPTLVIASDDSGPPAALEQLRASGVRVEVLELARSIPDVRDRIARIGELVDRQDTAAALIASFDADCARLADIGWTDRPRAMFLYARSGGTLNVSGTGTAGDAMLALAGLQNVVPGYEGYRPLTAEAAVQAAPDWLVLTDRGMQTAGGREAVRQAPGLSLTPAGQGDRIVTLDDLVMLAFGPRTCAGALALGTEVRRP